MFVRLLCCDCAAQVGLPLTCAQFDQLTAEVVIDRLVSRHLHRMALLLCDYLKIDKDRVLVHWACAKVGSTTGHRLVWIRYDARLYPHLNAVQIRASNDADPRALCDLIRGKLVATSGHVSYADIAATADAAGMKRLATMLLDYEPRAADKVPLLLKMREVDLALAKAIDSGDTDLVYLVLLHLKRTYVSWCGCRVVSRCVALCVVMRCLPSSLHCTFLNTVRLLDCVCDVSSG